MLWVKVSTAPKNTLALLKSNTPALLPVGKVILVLVRGDPPTVASGKFTANSKFSANLDSAVNGMAAFPNKMFRIL